MGFMHQVDRKTISYVIPTSSAVSIEIQPGQKYAFPPINLEEVIYGFSGNPKEIKVSAYVRSALNETYISASSLYIDAKHNWINFFPLSPKRHNPFFDVVRKISKTLWLKESSGEAAL
jgi:hypothetical protein